MADEISSFSPSSRKDSTTVTRKRLSRLRSLKSWFTNIQRRIFTSQRFPPPFSHPPHHQIQSHLFNKFPLETRRMIYDEVLDSYGTLQHILLSNNDHSKFTHMRCASPASHAHFQTWNLMDGVCNLFDVAYRKKIQNGWEIMPLLLSCRQIYLEFIAAIYSSINFLLPAHIAPQFASTVPAPHIALSHLRLTLFLGSPNKVYYWERGDGPMGPKDRFVTREIKVGSLRRALGHLGVRTPIPCLVILCELEWEAIWRSFGRLRVRSLVVEIVDHGLRKPEPGLLETFEVLVPWSKESETSGEIENVGFVIRRPPEGVNLMVTSRPLSWAKWTGRVGLMGNLEREDEDSL